LTTAKSHQLVLGFYIGTIIYTLLLLLNFEKVQSGEKETPAIAILLSIAFAIGCLVLFVYFIHSISKAIQVDNIMNSVFLKAKKTLQGENEMANKTKEMKAGRVRALNYTLNSLGNGYLRRVDLTELKHIAQEYDLQVEIVAEVGAFIVEGMPLTRLSTDPRESEELRQRLQDCFDLSEQEIVMEDYEGVKQLAEIAVKALSPGINDPGTALKAIDFLALLFIYRIKCDERNYLLDNEHNLRVIEKTVTLDELLHRYLSPIRTYGKADLQINLRLLKCLHNLLHQNAEHKNEAVIAKHALAVVYDAEHHIQNQIDRCRMNDAIKRFNEVVPPMHQLQLLEVQDVFYGAAS
jgi:uncharacterized membrane protein